MATSRGPVAYLNVKFETNILDGYHQLRYPQTWLDYAQATCYHHWFLRFQEIPGLASPPPPPTTGMRIEVATLLNAQLGYAHLICEGHEKFVWNKENRIYFRAGIEAFELFTLRGVTLSALDSAFVYDRLRYVDRFEVEELKVEDKECAVCHEPLSLEPSDAWMDPISIPKICFPELVKFFPLGKDERVRFTGMLTEIWERIFATPEHLLKVDLEPIKTLQVFCKYLDQAVVRYSRLSEAEKQEAEKQRFWPLKSDRGLSIQAMMDNEKSNVSAETVQATGADEPFRSRERTVETDCRHRFGIMCLGTWLSEHDTCPTCREVLVADIDHRMPTGEMEAYFRDHHEYLVLDLV